MFTDTITTGTIPVTYTKRAPKGARNTWVPSGDLPSNERRMEIGHEVTAAKRVSSLVKFALVRPHPTTGILEEASVRIITTRPASFTNAEMELINNHANLFHTGANFTKVLNQE